MIHRVRRIGVWQLAKTLGVLYLFLGFIFGLCIWLFASVLPSGTTGGAAGLLGMGIGGLIIIPIVYALLGVVFGAITAALYNLVAGWTGGVEIELEPGA